MGEGARDREGGRGGIREEEGGGGEAPVSKEKEGEGRGEIRSEG